MADKPLPVPDLQTLIESTPPTLLKKIRDMASPPGAKGNWMRFLNDKQLLEVFHRLRLGEPANRIVVKCQREWHIKPASKTGSLARSLRKFRQKAVGDIFDTEIKTVEEKKEVKELSERGLKVAEKIDALAELGWVIRIQADRIKILFDKEKKTIPFRFTDKSIQVFGDLVEKYSKMEQDLGLVDSKRPPAFNVNVSAKFKDLITNTVDDGQKVAAALGRVVEIADKESLTLSAGEDGQFTLKGKGDDDVGDTTIQQGDRDSGDVIEGDGTEPE